MKLGINLNQKRKGKGNNMGPSLSELFLKEKGGDLEEYMRKYGVVGLLDDFEAFLIAKDLMNS